VAGKGKGHGVESSQKRRKERDQNSAHVSGRSSFAGGAHQRKFAGMVFEKEGGTCRGEAIRGWKEKWGDCFMCWSGFNPREGREILGERKVPKMVSRLKGTPHPLFEGLSTVEKKPQRETDTY